jgi:hypothetical protein
VPKALALALGRRMARALSRSVRVFTVRAVLDGEDLDCLLDDVLLGKDGSARQGRWGTDLTAEHEDAWMNVCDGKPHYAASILTQDAAAEMLGEENDQRDQEWWLAPPPSLGSQRLDEIAKQARLAEKTIITVVAGRDCVRMSDAGTTVTSFVSKDDVARLREALAGLLVAP